jgi:multimeric flavodoxin WrbA
MPFHPKMGKRYGKCGVNDGLSPILEKMNSADAFVLGSPIYFGRKINTGFIYTMNW